MVQMWSSQLFYREKKCSFSNELASVHYVLCKGGLVWAFYELASSAGFSLRREILVGKSGVTRCIVAAQGVGFVLGESGCIFGF